MTIINEFRGAVTYGSKTQFEREITVGVQKALDDGVLGGSFK